MKDKKISAVQPLGKEELVTTLAGSNYAPNPNDNPLKVPDPTEIPNIGDIIICW